MINPMDRVQKIIDGFDDGLVKKEDFIEVFKVFIGVLKEIKTNNDSLLSGVKRDTQGFVSEQMRIVAKAEEEINEISNKVDGKISREVSEAMDEMKSLIPEIPDLQEFEDKMIAYFSSRIEELSSKIPKLPKEITGDDMVDKINNLPIESDKQIGKEHIRGLEEELRQIREIRGRGGAIGGSPVRRKIRQVNLTDQCDGATKDFTLPIKTIDVIGLFGTQFPVQYDPDVDWTFSGRILTLGSGVGAPLEGQTLWALIETL